MLGKSIHLYIKILIEQNSTDNENVLGNKLNYKLRKETPYHSMVPVSYSFPT